MKRLRFIWLIYLTLFASSLSAHDLLTSKFELDANYKSGAVLKLYLTQTGVHHAIVKKYPDLNFDDKEQYEKMVVSYLKDHILIKADDLPIEFGFGAVKIGSHETDVILHLKNYPEKVSKLDVQIDAFKENGNHHSVFWWFAPEETSKFVLSDKSSFRAFFQIGEKPFGGQQVLQASSPISLRNIAIMGLILIGGIYLAFRKKYFLKLTS